MKAILVWLILFFPLYSFAQSQTYSFAGTLSLHDGTHYSYKLQFRDSSGHISGYSITDIMGPDQTKTAVTGNVDVEKRILQFSETDIIYTKSRTDKDSFCFIHASLKLTEHAGAKLLKGKFKGYRIDGKTPCGNGNMTLYSAADILDKLMKIAPPRDSSQKTDISIQTSTSSKVIELSHGKTFEAKCDGKTASILLWDDKDIDNDIVSVHLNGKILINNYALTAGKKLLTIPLSTSASDTVALIAITEGLTPPNTARLQVVSGSRIYDINATTTLNEPVYIVLKHDLH